MTTIKSSTTATTAYQVVADTTGALVIQTGVTPTTALTVGSDQSVTFAGAVSLSGNQTTTGNLTVNGNTTLGDASTDTILMTGAPSIGGAGLGMGMGFKNRIINGGMVIDARNAGGSLANISNGAFITDRFQYDRAGLGITAQFTASQSTDAPTGFQNSLKFDTTTAQTLGATGGTYFGINHKVEGFNMSDLAGNTATLSFSVKATKTGTYSVVLKNSGSDRSFVGEYSVSVSNTWENKTVSIAALPTAGTWNYTNGTGLQVFFCLAVADDVGTATIGSWLSSNVFGSVNNVEGADSTANDFFITGVQLEKGSTATSFDYRPYGTELALCQRYYETYSNGTGTGAIYEGITGSFATTAAFRGFVPFKVTKRASPTLVVPTTYTTINWSGGNITPSAGGSNFSSTEGASINFTTSTVTAGQAATAGISSSAPVTISAEL